MCIDPGKISDVGFVACRKCWQCRENKIDDWVGRCVAESVTAKAAHVVTLTYGYDLETGDSDNIRAAVLTYSDVQKYLKRLRFAGYPVRYFIVGEYGSKKGRAHWHIILYWQKKVPQHKTRVNFTEKHWPHGWSYWDKATPEAVRYACKYLLKDPSDDEMQSWGPMVSKYPPLGDAHFQKLAEMYVDQGLSPQNLYYSFPDVRRNPLGFRAKTKKQYLEGAKPVQFHMHGKTAENFVSYFLQQWDEKHGTVPPKSKLLDKHNPKPKPKKGEVHFTPERKVRGKIPVPTSPPLGGTPPQLDKRRLAYFSEVDGKRLYYSHDQREGDLVWHENLSPVDGNKPAASCRRSPDELSKAQSIRAHKRNRSPSDKPLSSYRDRSKGT